MLKTTTAPLACSCSATSTANGAPMTRPTTPSSVPAAPVTHISVW
jgi:hypothetical protein